MIPETEAARALSVVEGTVRKQPPTSPELAVIEAALPSGALVESPSNGGPAGIKWRVRVFEYGLSKNRYPDPGCRPLALARLCPARLGKVAPPP